MHIRTRVRNRLESPALRALSVFDRAIEGAFVRSLRLQARLSGLLLPVPQLEISRGHPGSHGRGTATIQRWAAVEAELPAGPGFAVDVGSHAGFFSLALATRGYHVLGYEPDLRLVRIATAAAARSNSASVAFMPVALDPHNVTRVPAADVMLVMSVLHRWAELSGFDAALGMLATLWKRTRRVLFFELPNPVENRTVRPFLPDLGATPEACAARLEEILASLEIGRAHV